MSNIVSWEYVDKNSWTYSFSEKTCSYIAYQIEKLPDFTNPRFGYLCKENDNRQAEVVKKQITMLRMFNSLGNQWTISLRFKKNKGAIVLYLIFRYAGNSYLTEEELNRMDRKISSIFMKNEYSFKKINSSFEMKNALEISWANESAEITKNEISYESDVYPDGTCANFYVSYTWVAANNSMENVCSALMNNNGEAVIEVTIQPTKYLEEEKKWMNININRLKDCMNGETIKSETGKILWQGKKLPILKTPLDNYEKMNKQYETSAVFLSSIRIFTEKDVEDLATSFLGNCVKNEGKIQYFRKGFGKFDYMKSCYENVDISADTHTLYWNKNLEDAPFRAQRLVKLVSLEEITNFFRIPVPIKPGFPGFGFDTGLESFTSRKQIRSTIKLGKYLDESGIEDASAEFDSQQFAKHGLIVGVPGSGKTTAMFNILYQLWAVPEEQRIPFIILEPAKTEYRALKLLDEFKDDMLVFTLGDEGVSPFRFNPLEVLPGIKIENHISKLQACFVGAFDLFDPLPIFLEQAIRKTYEEKGWYEDSRGGEEGLETPTLSDLCRNAEYVISNSEFDSKMRSDFQASLLERLNSLRRGSKGRMLDTKHSIPMEDLMNKPVVIELDSLNGDEKSLMMMFLLSYVYEYCKVMRKSGSPLKHLLLVEEAHNLIGSQGGGSENRANPKAQTIELFVNMLAEMRALGQGILIADQLPTAIAPQAVKQTNVKVLMRVTAKDDREEIGNTMDLNEEQMHQVVNFKTGYAYLYHEGEDRVRAIRMLNFKGKHHVEEPPTDEELKLIMKNYEATHKEIYLPFSQCSGVCQSCNRRVRNQAEGFVKKYILEKNIDLYKIAFPKADDIQIESFKNTIGVCGISLLLAKAERKRILERYKQIGDCFGACVYIQMINIGYRKMNQCKNLQKKCSCDVIKKEEYLNKFINLKGEEKNG